MSDSPPRSGALDVSCVGAGRFVGRVLVREICRAAKGERLVQRLFLEERPPCLVAVCDTLMSMPSSRTRTSVKPALPLDTPAPAEMSPQLATLAKVPPGAGWIYEIKFDGYRLLARLEDGAVRLFTRNGNDWTDKMRGLADEMATLQVGNAWLDGEPVVLNDKGVPDFNALQNAFDRSREQSIVYFVFDVLFVDGVDLRPRPQSERSARLRELLATHSGSRIRMSEAFDADGATALRSACAMGLEGLIAKRLDAPYSATRSKAWLKLKCTQRREFVVGGFTERDKASHEVGSLLLGVYDASGDLIPAGSVGTGWDSATAQKLKELLAVIERPVSPSRERMRQAGGRAERPEASAG